MNTKLYNALKQLPLTKEQKEELVNVIPESNIKYISLDEVTQSIILDNIAYTPANPPKNNIFFNKVVECLEKGYIFRINTQDFISDLMIKANRNDRIYFLIPDWDGGDMTSTVIAKLAFLINYYNG